MALEVDEVERGVRTRRPAPRLDAPGRGEARALRELEIRGRTDEERLSRERLQANPVIFAEITCFAAEQESRTNLRHDTERSRKGGFLLLGRRARKTGPFGLI